MRENDSGEAPQEYQFMQRIDRLTVEQVLENTEDLYDDVSIDYESIPHNQVLVEARRHLESDKAVINAIGRGYHNFIKRAEAIPDIGDIEWDNLLICEFCPSSREFTLTMIDPIKEVSYIRSIRRGDEEKIINKILIKNNNHARVAIEKRLFLSEYQSR